MACAPAPVGSVPASRGASDGTSVRAPPSAKAPSAGHAPTAARAVAPPISAVEVPVPPPCPSGMLLVEGEYCTEVKHRCEESWYSKANRKTICERFASPGECVGSLQPKRFCIDRYAWPNQRGERPEVMNTFYQAQVKCAALGKRTCTESEWTFACEGPRMQPFPYGYVRDSSKCNGDRPWDQPDMKKVARRDPRELARLWQGVPSGTQPECVSDFGVADLPGNTDEVVASENFSKTWRGRYDSVHTGGPWYVGVRNQCRPKIYSHGEGFYYYFLSFRCCSEPDGAATDPRTPKQIARGRSFGFVERMASFGVAEMQEKLRLKRAGRCDCPDAAILCKTMCGSLLGPSATDRASPPSDGGR